MIQQHDTAHRIQRIVDDSVTFDMSVKIHELFLGSVEPGGMFSLLDKALSDGALLDVVLAAGQILQNPSNTHKGTMFRNFSSTYSFSTFFQLHVFTHFIPFT